MLIAFIVLSDTRSARFYFFDKARTSQAQAELPSPPASRRTAPTALLILPEAFPGIRRLYLDQLLALALGSAPCPGGSAPFPVDQLIFPGISA